MGSGLSGFVGSILTGDSGIGRDYKNLYRKMKDDYNTAGDMTRDTLGRLDERDQAYQNQLATGVLPKELKDAFARRRGALNDDEMRRRRNFSASLAQRRLQSGGQLSEAAGMEFQTEAERDLMEGRRSAEADISGQEGQMILQSTQDLYNRIDEIRKMRLGVSQAERDRAIQAMLASMSGRKDFLKETSQEARGWASMGMGGAGGGVSGG